MKRIALLFCACVQTAWICAQEVFFLSSPSGTLKTEVRTDGGTVRLELSDGKGKVLDVTGMEFEWEKNRPAGDWQAVSHRRQAVNRSWRPVYGETSLVMDKYNELEIDFQSAGDRKGVTLSVRLYDEGIAFRYLFDGLDFWNCTLTNEKTRFLFEKDGTTWVTERAQGAYSQTTLSAQKGVGDRPQVVRLDNDRYVAVGEAALVDYARMKLGKSETGLGLQSCLSGKVNLQMAGYRSPWRYVMVADHPGRLVEHNYFVLNLNEPNQIADTSWIKPGRVIREVTLTTAGGLACVDFAAKHGIEYVEFDAGWYGPEDDRKSDATTVTVDPNRSKGPLDLHKVIAYAESKGVGILVYVNQKALHNQLDEILPLYKEWGIKGVKYGFVDVGDQYATAWLHQAVRKAAKYGLMVDIHDEYRPTGYSRTYPNLMTQEGIRGDEESPSLEQSVHTFYNRMIGGAGDYTNCYFAERVTEKMGGRAAQLAKLVTLYSPWQFIYWYDRPEKAPSRAGGAGNAESVIREDEITGFYTSIPTVWDETRFVEGEMGQYSVVARRSGADWYVAVLNAGERRKVSIPLDALLLEADGREAVLYYQPEGKGKEVVRKKKMKCDAAPLGLEVAGNSGCVLYISKK